jgi:hypothetical protein
VPIDGAALDAPNPLLPLLGGELKAEPDTVAVVSADAQMTWRELDRVGLKRLAEEHLNPHLTD